MKIVKKREHISAPTFGELNSGDIFFSPSADNPDEPYMKNDEDGILSGGYAINLTSGFVEEFSDDDTVVKVEATLTIE